MNKPGNTIYVRWYGKVVPAEIIDRTKYCSHPIDDKWIPVLMEVPGSDGKPIVAGCKNICMFSPIHVYASAEEAQQAEDACRQIKTANPHASEHSRTLQPSPVLSSPLQSSTKDNPSKAWQAIQKFKQEHWDSSVGHLRVDAIEEFYKLWRAAVAAMYGITIEDAVLSGKTAETPATVIAADPGSPDGDYSAKTIVDNETGEIVQYAALSQQPQPGKVHPHPLVTKDCHQSLSQKMKLKPDKKKVLSTGRIEYSDCIQTSLFD